MSPSPLDPALASPGPAPGAPSGNPRGHASGSASGSATGSARDEGREDAGVTREEAPRAAAAAAAWRDPLAAVSWPRRRGAIWLALIGVAALALFRRHSEDASVLLTEWCVQVCVALAAARFASRPRYGASQQQWARLLGSTALVLVPWIHGGVQRLTGTGTGLEIVMLSSLAWGAVAAALFGQRDRTVSISVVASGFLTLFTTCISDHASATLPAYLWGVFCQWWLVTNFRRLPANCVAESQSLRVGQRLLAVGAASLVFAVAAWVVADRLPPGLRPTLELMPTSGGSSVHDPHARAGVGDGDALVAAREHASSFGAVDSDMFLDSDQPSLYDMYSESFGEPIRNKRQERAVALAPKNETGEESRVAEAQGANRSFTTERRGRSQHRELRNIESRAILRWIGRPHAHLAVERFEAFDGLQWLAPEDAAPAPPATLSPPALHPYTLGDRTWFSRYYDLRDNGFSPFIGSRQEALKFTGYRSPRIPATADLQLWHIDKVDMPDFFGFTSDRALHMPGRVQVPDYTIVRFVNRDIDSGRLDAALAYYRKASSRPTAPATAEAVVESDVVESDVVESDVVESGVVESGVVESGVGVEGELADLARRWAVGTQPGWAQVQAVLAGLHSEFRYANLAIDPSSDSVPHDATPLQRFLRHREGNAVMFATSAALMLRELGYHTRFVTGFYAAPARDRVLSGEIPIYADSVHAWVEVAVGNDEWVAVEPTPGFQLPPLRQTWSRWLQQHASSIGMSLAALSVVLLGAWRFRATLFDCGCLALGPSSRLLDDRRRIRLLVRILDIRCRLAGIARPDALVPKQWLAQYLAGSSEELTRAFNQFFTEADRIWYGRGQALSPAGRDAWSQLLRSATSRNLKAAARRLHTLELQGPAC
jgi:protein-glutamine gamma-glutamyltransferase